MADTSSSLELAPVPDATDWSMTRIIDFAMDVSRRDDVCVGDITTAFGPASFLPLLILPGLILVSPLSGIPFFSSLLGFVIILVAVQMVAGRSCVWLPAWVKRRSVAGERLTAALTRLRPIALWFDRNAHQRLGVMFHRPLWYLLPLSCAMLAAFIPFLELVPFSASLLGAAVTMIALGMCTRDGVWVMVALVPVGVALTIVSKVVF